jgi:hypothetical protein
MRDRIRSSLVRIATTIVVGLLVVARASAMNPAFPKASTRTGCPRTSPPAPRGSATSGRCRRAAALAQGALQVDGGEPANGMELDRDLVRRIGRR